MTTESQHDTRTGLSPLLGALAAGAVAVLGLVVVAAVAAGQAAVVGAVVGGVLTLLVFALGVAVVGVAARVLPSASLLVALMTYALQLLVLALAVALIERAGPGSDALSRGWFAAGVITVTVLWLAGQTVAVARQRIPHFDLAASEEPAAHPGGER